jgi:hypothetical protein
MLEADGSEGESPIAPEPPMVPDDALPPAAPEPATAPESPVARESPAAADSADPALPLEPSDPLLPDAEIDGALAAEAVANPAVVLRTYDLPTARRVVSSGLQLSLASSSDLRRASIYIGLLVLAAFGPAALAVLLTLGRLGDSAGDVLSTLIFSPEQVALTQPEIGGVLIVLLFVLIGGLVSYVAITIDAGIIAVAILGGRAADRPLRLWEAILRARQSFWRIAGAGFVVGLVSGLVQVALTAVIGNFTQSVETSSVVTAIVGTLAVAPFAYVSAGIVLGDVGAVEALSRSWRLFRARPWLAVVVVLFTLVTSAIQLFALSAGLDLLLRASDVLHVSLTEGALAFLAAATLMLAAITAFGSLLFTVGAIVSAPQVTGFLGLTFFSGGLDRARSPEPRAPNGFRWVTRPMLALLIGTTAVIALEIPAISSIEPPPVGQMLGFIRSRVLEQPGAWSVFGTPATRDDPAADVAGGTPVATPGPEIAGAVGPVDLVLGEYAFLYEVPAWILDDVFDCGARDVVCAGEAGDRAAFDNGALLFLQRSAEPLANAPRGLRAGVLLSVEGDAISPRGEREPYAGASRVVVTSFGADPSIEVVRFSGGAFRPFKSAARAAWIGTDLYTLIPFESYRSQPTGWDVITIVEGDSGEPIARDWLRSDVGGRLRDWDFGATLDIGTLAD